MAGRDPDRVRRRSFLARFLQGERRMIIVDTALAKRLEANDPVRVAVVGAGYMARCIAVQITTGIPGMRLVAVANRTIAKAHQVYREAGVPQARYVSSLPE